MLCDANGRLKSRICVGCERKALLACRLLSPHRPIVGRTTGLEGDATMMESQAGERASLDMMTESEPRRLPVRDSLSDLLGPDVILPQQFFDGPRGDSDFSPEKALMLAVLEDAIRCFQEYFRTTRARPRMLSRQAERWIRTRDWNWPFSFNNVCDSIGIDS